MKAFSTSWSGRLIVKVSGQRSTLTPQELRYPVRGVVKGTGRAAKINEAKQLAAAQALTVGIIQPTFCDHRSLIRPFVVPCSNRQSRENEARSHLLTHQDNLSVRISSRSFDN